VNASCARPGLARSEWADVRRMMDHLDFPVPDPVLKENPLRVSRGYGEGYGRSHGRQFLDTL